jgi:hypothetical protein
MEPLDARGSTGTLLMGKRCIKKTQGHFRRMKKTVTDGRWNTDTCTKYVATVEKVTMDYAERDVQVRRNSVRLNMENKPIEKNSETEDRRVHGVLALFAF